MRNFLSSSSYRPNLFTPKNFPYHSILRRHEVSMHYSFHYVCVQSWHEKLSDRFSKQDAYRLLKRSFGIFELWAPTKESRTTHISIGLNTYLRISLGLISYRNLRLERCKILFVALFWQWSECTDVLFYFKWIEIDIWDAGLFYSQVFLTIQLWLWSFETFFITIFIWH